MEEVPDGETLSWNPPQVEDTQITVSPTKTFQKEDKEYCEIEDKKLFLFYS